MSPKSDFLLFGSPVKAKFVCAIYFTLIYRKVFRITDHNVPKSDVKFTSTL